MAHMYVEFCAYDISSFGVRVFRMASITKHLKILDGHIVYANEDNPGN